jgi:molybdopterin/thiamine biosynthesis adenylyltransferase
VRTDDVGPEIVRELRWSAPTAAAASRLPPVEVFPVAGVTAGFIGMIQATEVCKYLLCRGDLLAGRLLLWDGMQGRIEEIPVEQDPDCEACAGRSTGSW